uniref:Uncharacterized protein n=1 Tax=Eutreptiella gymnastica TaxID=73025 RepID=A0A7S1IZN3_9EUGL
MGLSKDHMSFLPFLFKALIAFLLHAQICMNKFKRPQVRQDCPLSPTFLQCLFASLNCQQGISDSISVLLSVNGLVIVIHDLPSTVAQYGLSVKYEMCLGNTQG